jgi:hypothetical protein
MVKVVNFNILRHDLNYAKKTFEDLSIEIYIIVELTNF